MVFDLKKDTMSSIEIYNMYDIISKSISVKILSIFVSTSITLGITNYQTFIQVSMVPYFIVTISLTVNSEILIDMGIISLLE